MFPLVVFASGSSTAVVTFSLISLLTRNKSLGFKLTWKFISLVALALIASILELFNYWLIFYVYLIMQLILIIILYLSYFRAAFYMAILLPITLSQEIMSILSLYLSIFMTATLSERKTLEKKGNWIILLSLVILDLAIFIELIYFIFGGSLYLELSEALYDLFIVSFFSLFILPSELTYEKE